MSTRTDQARLASQTIDRRDDRPPTVVELSFQRHLARMSDREVAALYYRLSSNARRYKGLLASAHLHGQMIAIEQEQKERADRDRNFAVSFARALLLLACILLLAAMCSGCASTDAPVAMQFATSEARNRQVLMTGLMALDTAQTVTIGRSPDCLSEGNQVAAYAFGSRTPSPERVLITNAVYIAAHWALGSYLDRKVNAPIDLSIPVEQDMARRSRWTLMRGIYQFATTFGHGFAVARNARKGIEPFSSFNCGGAR